MIATKKTLLKNCLSNIVVEILVADFIKCPQSWREIDYTPSYNKFYYIMEGEGWLQIGEEIFYPKPGQLFMMPAGIKQSYSYVNENVFTKYWCHFNAFIGDANLFDIIKIPYFIDGSDSRYLNERFSALVEHYGRDDLTASIRMKSVLLDILAYYIESMAEDDIYMVATTSVEKLSHVIEYIDSHLSDNLSVEDLANRVHFHPNYFSRLFHNQIGCSPIQYISKRRLDKAKALLSSTAMTVTEIAESTGFKDVFYFSKTFKSSTGLSPTEYKSTRS